MIFSLNLFLFYHIYSILSESIHGKYLQISTRNKVNLYSPDKHSYLNTKCHENGWKYPFNLPQKVTSPPQAAH